MSEMRSDPRRRRSRAMFRSALVSLIQEKPIAEVTVKDLVTRAELARATFYANYVDKYDFIDRTIDEVLNGFILKADRMLELQPQPPTPKEQWSLRIRVFYQYIADNSEFYAAMLGRNGPPQFRPRMASVGTRYLAERYGGMLLRELGSIGTSRAGIDESPKHLLDLAINGIVNLQVSTVEYWLNTGMQYSVDCLVEFQDKANYAILRALRLEE